MGGGTRLAATIFQINSEQGQTRKLKLEPKVEVNGLVPMLFRFLFRAPSVRISSNVFIGLFHIGFIKLFGATMTHIGLRPVAL